MSRDPLPKTIPKLLELVRNQVIEVTAPGYADPKLEYELLNNLWEKVKAHIGYYGATSFDLNADQKEMYREADHYMKLLELMVTNA